MNANNETSSSWELEKQRLARLNLNAPALLENNLGYFGDARFIAFFCDALNDQLFYCDGRLTQAGNYQVWLLWSQQRSTTTELWSYDFGNHSQTARHWLMLDRDERDFYAGSVDQVRHFLQILPGDMRTSLNWLINRKRLFGRQRIRQPLTVRQKIIDH